MRKKKDGYFEQVDYGVAYLYGLITLTLTPRPCFVPRLLGKAGVQKWGFPLDLNWGLPHHNALSTYGTPPKCSHRDSDFLPV